ncbi:MAG: hypothetical protein V1794_09800 [Candidatus Glassbacteria bacterium]
MNIRRLWKRAFAAKHRAAGEPHGEQVLDCRSANVVPDSGPAAVGDTFSTEQETTRRLGNSGRNRKKKHSGGFFII